MQEEFEKTREELEGLSMTGRLCYLFMCLEKYLLACYPDRDWTPVAKRCWQWTNVYWDEGCDIYSPVVPEFLLEFDNYEETNRRAFDGNLSEKDYLTLTDLFADVTAGSHDDEINQILMLPIGFSSACEGTNFANANEPTLTVLYEARIFCTHVLRGRRGAYPDVFSLKNAPFSQTILSPNGKEKIFSRGISYILL